VPANGDALRAAAGRLDLGLGTVWQGDTKEGFNGGAEYLRWVRTEEHAADAEAFFAAHCDRVRVAPFLEGIPCSIHGTVFPDAIAVYRPVENVILRKPRQNRLHYGSTATFYDPRPEDREFMRAQALNVGKLLRERVAYRGTYTVDGISTEEGWHTVELNTRAGAGVMSISRSVPDLPFILFDMAVIAGDWAKLDAPADAARQFETFLVEGSDAVRGGGAMAVLPGTCEETEERALVWEGERYRPATEGETPDAKLIMGPGDVGRFLRFVPDPQRTPVGPSIAPRAVAALAVADEVFDAGIGPLEPPRDVRIGGS
jgi:hypothetical protein